MANTTVTILSDPRSPVDDTLMTKSLDQHPGQLHGYFGHEDLGNVTAEAASRHSYAIQARAMMRMAWG